VAPKYLGGKGKNDFYSRILGVEIRGRYDGVSYWECPECGSQWNRDGSIKNKQ
jgi:hypothetical protein